VGTSEPKFPKWAPAEIIARWHEENRELEKRERNYDKWLKEIGPRIQSDETRRLAEADYKESIARESRVRDLIERMLTRDDMRAVWAAMAKVKPIGSVSHSVIFTACVVRAWSGPRGEEKWTPAERTKWIKDVADLADALAGKLCDTGADEMLWKQYHSEKLSWDMRQFAAAALAGEIPPNHKREFNWMPGQVSELLRNVGRQAKFFLAPAKLGKPGDALARRAYFVRYLSGYCREYMGGPRLALVTATAAIALEDETITQRQVARLVRRTSSDGKA
jgi:hypothetical protein